MKIQIILRKNENNSNLHYNVTLQLLLLLYHRSLLSRAHVHHLYSSNILVINSASIEEEEEIENAQN